MEKASEKYLPILAKVAAGDRSELEVETETLGFNHADLGSVLAIKWFLSEDLTIAIRYHHTPSKDPYQQDLSSLIHLADHIAWTSGNPSTSGTPTPPMENEVYDHVGLDPQQVEDLLPKIQDDFLATGLPW
jgi:HD-like signal output (HDOD) protein